MDVKKEEKRKKELSDTKRIASAIYLFTLALRPSLQALHSGLIFLVLRLRVRS